ncbi:STAS domain-containing protein [Dactylosporangium aurantiacum]|uniref:STAS domain-containing protein n=1 Tax=Dactylosporangium aurantiacum TaxID=35754 RepID=A0A9Q9ME71_9ACTN|nr:STAS domain-containing protein [Dactylosporangium aurantiacum]MDG6108706.1 STAS domain-containing protein [Dactylosporangium aurantiacum]UWZ51070.1 STAS domain-containing protein [Dactylosporangium aurantiacum]
MTRPDRAASGDALRVLRFDAVVNRPRDIGHLALYFTVLSGSAGRRPIHLQLDVATCTSIDTAGMEILVELHRRLRDQGGRLTLRKPPPRVRHLLQRMDPDAASGLLADGVTDPAVPTRNDTGS